MIKDSFHSSTTYFLSDYLQHAPCMRRVQAGYEQCADTYQIQIKMLNENAATQRQQNVAATALANANANANGNGGNGADGESAHPAATGTVIDWARHPDSV